MGKIFDRLLNVAVSAGEPSNPGIVGAAASTAKVSIAHGVNPIVGAIASVAAAGSVAIINTYSDHGSTDPTEGAGFGDAPQPTMADYRRWQKAPRPE